MPESQADGATFTGRTAPGDCALRLSAGYVIRKQPFHGRIMIDKSQSLHNNEVPETGALLTSVASGGQYSLPPLPVAVF